MTFSDRVSRFALARSRGAAGFTLLEIIVVIAIIAIIAGVAVLSFTLDEKTSFEKPAEHLSRMVKQASRSAVLLGQPVVIAFDKKGFGLTNAAIQGGEARCTLPKEVKVSVQRWNAKGWADANDFIWTFYPSGISDALRFKFQSDEGVEEIGFNPLTGSVTSMEKFVRK